MGLLEKMHFKRCLLVCCGRGWELVQPGDKRIAWRGLPGGTGIGENYGAGGGEGGGHFLWGKDDPFRHYLACTKALGVVSQYILGSESL